MIFFLGWISFLILLFISIIHLYWGIGGKWGLKAVLPTDEFGNKKLNPKFIDSILVGLFLGSVALLYGVKARLFLIDFFPNWILKYGLYIVSIIFILRSIGDFKYVGFTKKLKNTSFSKNDTNYFSPLCLFLGVVGVLIEVLK